MDYSIVIPAKNEASGLRTILPELVSSYGALAEIIVVDDGSTDDTASVLKDYPIIVVSHPYSKGNGASIKSGARAAKGQAIIFMDGDGQHKPSDIDKLIQEYESGYDMVVGARSSVQQASFGRLVANGLYNALASWMVSHRVFDLTSGLRVVHREKFLEFISLLPNGFSYPTTTTMAFFRAGYSVSYMPIDVQLRLGKSHIKFNDGIKFLLIIFKIGTLYSPLKLFFPVSLAFFMIGTGYYAYTFVVMQRFTNMSALMLTTSIIIFMIGLVSEQITNLLYSR